MTVNKRNLLALTIILAGASVILFRPVLSPKSIIDSADLIKFFYFIKCFMVNSVKTFHELPLWNPTTFAGFPFAGNPQSALFYPFTALFFLIPVHYAFTIIFLIHLVIAGFGVYIYLSRKNVSFVPAICASLIFITNYKVTGHIEAGHFNLICCYAYIPWIFVIIDIFTNKPTHLNMIKLSLVFAISFLAGHQQLFYYQVLIGTTYTIFRLIGKSNKISILKKYIISCFLTLTLISISLLPIIELFFQSNRNIATADFSFSNQSSFRFFDLIYRFFAPGHLNTNWEQTIYFGILPLIIILLGYKLKKYFIYFSLLFVFAFLFSIGSEGYLFDFCCYSIPGIKLFRAPGRIFFFAEFAISIMTGLALENCTKQKLPLQRKTLIISMIILSIIIFCSQTIFWRVSLSMMAFAILIFLSKSVYKHFIPVIITVLIMLDIVSVSSKSIYKINVSDIIPKSPMYKQLIYDKDIFRVWDISNVFEQYLAPHFNSHKISGYQPITIADYVEYIQSNDPLMPDFLNAKYIFSSKELTASSLIKKGTSTGKSTKIFLYENSAAFGRGFLVPATSKSIDKSLQNCLKTREKPISAYIKSYTPNKIVFYTKNNAPSYLITSEIIYPGWKVTVDNRPTQILSAKKLFRSVYLDSGNHVVTFRYKPTSFFAGLLITLSGLVFCVATLFFSKKSRHTKNNESK